MSAESPDKPSLDDVKNAPIPKEPDESSKRSADDEAKDADQRKIKAEAKALDELVTILKTLRDDQKSEADARTSYINLLPWFIGVWLFVLAVIVILQGLCVFQLSDRVIVTLIGSTGAGLIGVFATVVTYLFTRKSEQVEFYRLVVNKLTSRIPENPDHKTTSKR